jgi:hypothetical protein
VKILFAMIRKQRLTVDVHRRQLARQQQLCADRAAELTRCDEARRDAAQYLTRQTTAGADMALDLLLLAMARHGAQQQRHAAAQQAYDQAAAAAGQARNTLARAEKTLEKFTDRLALHQAEARGEEQRREWLALDEWVVNASRWRP